MKLVFLIVVVMCVLLPKALGIINPIPKKASTSYLPDVTTKVPKTIAPTTPTKAPPPVCGKNEVYSACGATGCVDTCANPTRSQISKCMCIPGCICIDGYLRNSKNECVAPQQCDTCKENESYTTCGTACPKTCENKDKSFPCTLQCVVGCFCNEGYVRSADGVCILAKNCPKTCPENEEYNECGTACPKTCKTKDALIKCTANCVAGCFCQEGYIRDDINGKCIPENDCPLVCGPNQVINKCPPCPKGLICTEVCVPICECIPGYIFDNTGTCVVKEPKTYSTY